MADQWEKSQHNSFTLWDIDREFQHAYEAYELWQTQHRRRRPSWACFGNNNRDDSLARALSLGRQIQRLFQTGKELFGSRFEQGDSRCHTVLSAQLLRLQHEIRQPLYDGALSPTATPIPYDDILATAKSIRRTCLTALREQFVRCDSRSFSPVLPPPRFRVDFCPYADQLRKDVRNKKPSSLRTRKVKSTDPHDDREGCVHCHASLSVTAHSGLPNYRHILFASHMARDPSAPGDRATFACNTCYKTFDDSYAFLDHVFQKQIDSDLSCMKRSLSGRWVVNQEAAASDPNLVEQCLKNCLLRELTRARTLKQVTMMGKVTIKEVRAHA